MSVFIKTSIYINTKNEAKRRLITNNIIETFNIRPEGYINIKKKDIAKISNLASISIQKSNDERLICKNIINNYII